MPRFGLYGEAAAGLPEDLLHIESVQSRSHLHHWEIEPHVHPGLHQILWLRAGLAEIELDGQRQTGRGPLAVVLPPGTVHGFRFRPGADGHVLTLDPRLLLEGEAAVAGGSVTALFREARVWPVAEDEVPRLAALIANLAQESAAPGRGRSPVPMWLARAVVWRLAHLAAREAVAAGDPDHAAARGAQARFTRFLVLLEAHHAEHWPVQRYADRLGLSAERLNRLVRAETGRSALQLVHERLLREARRRLVHLAAPVSQVGYDLGFEDPAYFCRFFKRHTGLSPRAFRQQPPG